MDLYSSQLSLKIYYILSYQVGKNVPYEEIDSYADQDYEIS